MTMEDVFKSLKAVMDKEPDYNQPTIVSFAQYKACVRRGLIKKEEALNYLSEKEVDMLIEEGKKNSP